MRVKILFSIDYSNYVKDCTGYFEDSSDMVLNLEMQKNLMENFTEPVHASCDQERTIPWDLDSIEGWKSHLAFSSLSLFNIRVLL